MLDKLERRVQARWQDLNLAGHAPESLSFLLTSGSIDRHGSVTVRAFRDGDALPLFLGKIARDGPAHQWLAEEHEVLQELEQLAPRHAGALFPRALFLEQSESRLVTGETLLPGIPLVEMLESRQDSKAQAATAFDVAKAWLLSFWKETGLLGASEAALWEGFLRSAHFCLHNFALEEETRLELERILREWTARRDLSSLCGFSHGDCRVARFLVVRNRIGAIGWQHARKRQFPWFDPLHFALDYSARFGAPNQDFTAGVELAFFAPTPLRQATRAFLADCFEEAGVVPDILPLALPATLVDILHRRVRILPFDDAETLAWLSCLERVLRPDAREGLASLWEK
jgi:hypothetical protein